MTVTDLLARTTSGELTEWLALLKLENEEFRREELIRRTKSDMDR